MKDLSSLLEIATVLTGVLAFMVLWIANHRAGRHTRLEALFSAGVAGGSVPTGIVLVYCAFVPSAIAKLSGISLYVAFAGLGLILVAGKTIKDQFPPSNQEKNLHQEETLAKIQMLIHSQQTQEPAEPSGSSGQAPPAR